LEVVALLATQQTLPIMVALAVEGMEEALRKQPPVELLGKAMLVVMGGQVMR
jgi:hypothetical protein